MPHKIFRLFLVLSLVFAFVVIQTPGPAHAAGPWYVTPTGDDNNDCLSPGAACATINGAIGKSSPGDTINISIGTYAGSGNEVVLIDRDITLLGGWDTNFTTQNGISKIDGQNARRGIAATFVATASLSHLMVNNADGVAIYQGGATLTINNSSIQNSNNAGLFVGCCGNATVNNTTIANNKGTGIVNDQGNLSLNNTSISKNMGGITNFGGSVSISNSILAGDIQDCAGILTSGGNNIVGNTAGCSISASNGDQFDIDPKLGTFLPEQGYDPLLSNSPAIDAGNPAFCPATDQRSVARVGICDIGAYEYTIPGAAVSLSLVGGDNQNTATTFAFPNPFQAAALDNQGSPVSGITINFTAPESGASGIFADTGTNTTSVNTDESGVATAPIFTANTIAGTYVVSASATGLGAVNFNLEQVVRPTNDNFANATSITSLPFSDSVDNTNATTELDEPQFCAISPNTVWYSFTPSSNGAVQVDMVGSSFSDTVLNLYQVVGSGINGLGLLQCATNFGSTIVFNANVGVTYYLQAGSFSSPGGDLHLNVQKVPPPANDNFANATIVPSLPFDDAVNTSAAGTEANEKTPSCATNGISNTAWYAFTPTVTESISARNPSSSFIPVMGVYTGDSLANLTEVGCQMNGSFLTFRAQAGITYYFQAGMEIDSGASGPMNFHLEVTPPPVAGFTFNPLDPSVFDPVGFCDFTSDPGEAGFQSFTWDFGDHTAISTTAFCLFHQYAADGDYTVQHSAITVDGRTASISQVVHVRTHDVAITKIAAPNSANSGQTKTITVNLRNKAYPEMVQIDLYKSVPGGFQWVGTLTKSVPALSGNRTTSISFNYTFTSDDARIGKVTFKAVATVIGARDVFPIDNEAISSPPTKVAR